MSCLITMLCQRMASPGFWVWNFQFRLQTKGFPEGKFALYKMGKCQYCRKFIGWRHDLIQEKDKSKRGSCSKSTTKITKLDFKRQKKNQIWCFQHVFTWPLNFIFIHINSQHEQCTYVCPDMSQQWSIIMTIRDTGSGKGSPSLQIIQFFKQGGGESKSC